MERCVPHSISTISHALTHTQINQARSQGLGAAGCLTIQNQLGCCGYFSPFIEATVRVSSFCPLPTHALRSPLFFFLEKQTLTTPRRSPHLLRALRPSRVQGRLPRL
jgi:hypothetical protein